MKKLINILLAAIMFLIICTSPASAAKEHEDEYHPGTWMFFANDIGYRHAYGSKDVQMDGSYLQGNLKTLNIPETVNNQEKKYTVTEIIFTDENTSPPKCVYTIETIMISKNLKRFNTSYSYKPYLEWRNLKTINIPKDGNLKSIGYFNNCPKLKSIHVPASVTDIGISNCPNLKMTVSKDNPKYKMRNTRYLCSKNGKIAYEYFGKQKSVTVPKGITVLYGTYSGNKYIKKATIPSSVKTIKTFTFTNCKGLSKVIIKNKNKSPKIAKESFDGTKKGIKFYVKNKRVAKSLKKQLKGSGVKKAKILVGKKVVYKNVK